MIPASLIRLNCALDCAINSSFSTKSNVRTSNANGMAMKVLIVDDNAGIRRLLRRTLFDTASDIWECSDGADALAAYKAHQPNVVLMDIQMPIMDGLSATKQIMDFDPAAQVIVVTDYQDRDLQAIAFEAGACRYV
jgi:CheY-like chemotaxis protein